jgi:hypothetical protein
MRTRFVACPGCGRHVRAGDSSCPFCGASAPVAKPLRTLTQRLTRAALQAAGAAGAVVAIGDCGGQETRNVAFYGAACIDDDCGVTVVDSGADVNDAYPSVFYGSPCIDGSCLPPEDAGTGEGDAPADAGGDVADAPTSDGATGD